MPTNDPYDDPYATPPAPPRTIASVGNNAALQQNVAQPIFQNGRITPASFGGRPSPTPVGPSTDPIQRISQQIPRPTVQNSGTMDTFGAGAVQPQTNPATAAFGSAFAKGNIFDALSAASNAPAPIGLPMTQPATIAPLGVTPPGTRAVSAAGATPSAGPAAVTPAADPNAPIGQDVDPQAALNKQLNGPINAVGSNFIARGNAGITTLAQNQNALGAFNDTNAANGTGISATSTGGKLTIAGVGATAPQPFTQGYDLAANNAKMRASLDAGYESDRKAQIADLTSQLGNSNAPPGSPRAQALMGQIAALGQIGQAQQSTNARANLENAQGALATAQAGQVNQATKLSAANQKQVSDLQAKFVNEPDPGKQKMMQDQILTLLGKDPKEGQFQVVTQQVPLDPNNPLAGTRNVATIVNQRTGLAQSVDDAVANGIGTKGNASTPPPNHVAALKANPALATQFDQMYGAGAAKKALAGK